MPIQIAQDLNRMRNLCDKYKIAYPAGVKAAEAAHKAALDLLAAQRSAVSADPTTVTAENASAVFEAMLMPVSLEARVATAQRLADAAHTKVHQAWNAGLHDFLAALPEHFNHEVATFTESLEALGGKVDPGSAVIALKAKEYNAMVAAAEAMKQIVSFYRSVMPRRDTGNTHLDYLDPFVRVPDRTTITRIPRGLGVGSGDWDPQWIAHLLTLPGVQIKWIAGPQQIANALPINAQPTPVNA